MGRAVMLAVVVDVLLLGGCTREPAEGYLWECNYSNICDVYTESEDGVKLCERRVPVDFYERRIDCRGG